MTREELKVCVKGFATDLAGVKRIEEERLNTTIRDFAEAAFNLLVEDIKKHPTDATATAIVSAEDFKKIDMIVEMLKKDDIAVMEFVKDAVGDTLKYVSVMAIGKELVAVDVTF